VSEKKIQKQPAKIETEALQKGSGTILLVDDKDMIMPDMGGGETFDHLKKIKSDIKAILSNGYTLQRKARDIMEMGCQAFIHKPFTIHELSQKIRGVFNIRV
jgi:CheY-like chemotaxis protein